MRMDSACRPCRPSVFLLPVRAQDGLITGLLRVVLRQRGYQASLLGGARRGHGVARHALPPHEFQLSHDFTPAIIVNAERGRYSSAEARSEICKRSFTETRRRLGGVSLARGIEGETHPSARTRLMPVSCAVCEGCVGFMGESQKARGERTTCTRRRRTVGERLIPRAVREGSSARARAPWEPRRTRRERGTGAG